jgi:hypothetical protein
MDNDEYGPPEQGPGTDQTDRSSLTGLRSAASRTLGRGGSRLGLIVIAVGLVVIGVGWNGAAGSGGEVNHVPVVQAQLPWLLSGGFLGLGIVVLGAAMVIANAYRESEARLSARFEQLIGALERDAGVVGGSDQPSASRQARTVVAGTSSFHRPECRLVKGRSEARLVDVSTALDLGLNPCRICHPMDDEIIAAEAGSYSTSTSNP